MNDQRLIERFVKTFSKLDELVAWSNSSIPAELDAGVDDSPWARQKWKPAIIPTERRALTEIYATLGAAFPPLFEELLLSYRWLDVDLSGFVRLFANPPGPSLAGLLARITADSVVASTLCPLGLIPFGTAAEDNHDQICFDTTRRSKNLDCPIIQVEHEALLCHSKLGESWEIADSFRSFMEEVIAKAEDL